MKISSVAVIAAFGFLSTAAAATPLQDCAPSSVPMVCLDAKLKAAKPAPPKLSLDDYLHKREGGAR